MKILVAISSASVALFTATAGIGAGPDEAEQSPRTLVESLPSGAVSNAEVLETNGFRVESSRNAELGADLAPTGNHFEGLIIEADGIFKVGVEKGRPASAGGGVAIYHRDTGAPLLVGTGSDGDGRLDVVSYSVVDKSGQVVREVTDYDADGQAGHRCA